MGGVALSTHTARLAIEALRNGVPNREAVRELGCNQPQVETRFVEMLERTAGADDSPANAQGMLVSGGFGTGKSHLLTHLEYLALSRNFICSKVTISKETPFYDLGKVFAPAIESGRLPDRSGQLVEELALAMKPASENYEGFFRRIEDAASKGVLSRIFPATLRAYERTQDFDLQNDIESFWAGDRILVSRINAELRRIGEMDRFRFRSPKIAELPPQRLHFAVELIKGAGYAGWVVLLDEIELIGSYSILQRGRSYAEIARWLGFAQDETFPGLVVVGAVTDDFAAAVIEGKRDRELVRPKLEGSARHSGLAARTETGMRLLEHDCLMLERPDDADVATAMETLRRLYARAYDWDPPLPEAPDDGAGFLGRMRYKVRAAINEWDLRRLRPGSRPQTQIEIVTPGYDENTDLEKEARDDGE